MTMAFLANFSTLTFDHSLGGSFTRDPRAVCWHTTEGATVSGAVSVYKNKLACPHLTVDPTTYEKYQHVPLDRSCYALQRGDDAHYCGTQTNRSGIIQVEIVGHAGESWSWSKQRLQWLGEEVLAPIFEACPTIPRGPVYMGGRMDEAEWDAWPGGMCGHRNVCCQPAGHWDPGDLDLTSIVGYAMAKISPLENDDMPTAQEVAKALMDELVPIHDYATGADFEAPLRVVEGYKLSELSLIRYHLTGVTPK